MSIDVSARFQRCPKEIKEKEMYNLHPFGIVTAFESSIAQYTGSKYAVAVDSCTNALLLCCLYTFAKIKREWAEIPRRTYVGVAQSIKNAGGRILWRDEDWKGYYPLAPWNIIDSARFFQRGMYGGFKGELVCLSFHWTKGLKIGKAGIILTDDMDANIALRKMRYDGRSERIHPRDDKFTRGYHCYLSPEVAARGLLLMQNPKDEYPDEEEYSYGDLSLQEIFK